ncbi:MAG: FapA family protein, partial [Oscillospiraceae bacterium]
MEINVRKEETGENIADLHNDEVIENEQVDENTVAAAVEPQNENDENSGEEEIPPPPPVDCIITITVSSDKQAAYIEITPPENGGEDVSAPKIIEALKENKITTGIKRDLIFKLILEKSYNEKKLIAEGVYPVDGIKGKITHLYDLSKKNQPKINNDGCVDFKDTGLITNILKDNVICEIVKPVDPIDGIDVYGEVVHGAKPPQLNIPKGVGTYISEDGLSLCAQTKGNLKRENGLYNVDEVFVISGDVDISTGDIDFVGKVEVRGNILEGYSVKCVGDIVVFGMIEGAT